jgi:hypothetical protein
MELSVQGITCYRIIITDGIHVDVLGDGERPPESIIVPYEDAEAALAKGAEVIKGAKN